MAADPVPLHRLAQIIGHDFLDTNTLYIQGKNHDLQHAVEIIGWAYETMRDSYA